MSADSAAVERLQAEAPAWFRALRDRICAEIGRAHV